MKHARVPAGRHRAPVRPRYGRIGVSLAALATTTVAVLGGAGVLPGTGPAAPAADLGTVASDTTTPSGFASEPEATDQPDTTEQPDTSEQAETSRVAETTGTAADAGAALPPRSGTGTRIVFSEGQQRVWLVDPGRDDADEAGVWRTYLVSGSVFDNLEPGTYEVFSRSRHAVGIDDSGTMEFFVRFTRGDQGAAIGFHTIPVDDGAPVQTRAELGTPLSHGCIRQARADAVALWRTAPVGTTVVVTA